MVHRLAQTRQTLGRCASRARNRGWTTTCHQPSHAYGQLIDGEVVNLLWGLKTQRLSPRFDAFRIGVCSDLRSQAISLALETLSLSLEFLNLVPGCDQRAVLGEVKQPGEAKSQQSEENEL